MSTWSKCPQINAQGERCEAKAKPGLNFMQCINKSCKNYSEALRAEYFASHTQGVTSYTIIPNSQGECPWLNCSTKKKHLHGPFEFTPPTEEMAVWDDENNWTVARPYLGNVADPALDKEEDTKPLGYN